MLLFREFSLGFQFDAFLLPDVTDIARAAVVMALYRSPASMADEKANRITQTYVLILDNWTILEAQKRARGSKRGQKLYFGNNMQVQRQS